MTNLSPALSSNIVYAGQTPPEPVAFAKTEQLEDGFVLRATRKPGLTDGVKTLGNLVGVCKPPQDIGPVGGSGAMKAGAAVGALVAITTFTSLGVTALAVQDEPYHSKLRGILFLTVGNIGGAIVLGALGACLAGACCGGRSSPRKDMEMAPPAARPNQGF